MQYNFWERWQADMRKLAGEDRDDEPTQPFKIRAGKPTGRLTTCERHGRAYDVGEGCPYCE